MSLRTFTATLVRLGPLKRRLLLIAADALLLPLSLWLSFWLQFGYPVTSHLLAGLWLMPAAWFIGLPLYALSGQYKGLTRYVGSLALYRLAGRNGLLVFLLALTGVLLLLPPPPRSSWLLLWLLLTVFTGAVCFALRDVLLSLQNKPRPGLAAVEMDPRSRPAEIAIAALQIAPEASGLGRADRKS